YEPAFGIIGDPAKRNPTTRQSADHSMVYIIATLLRKALDQRAAGKPFAWNDLMLEPADYSAAAINDKRTRTIMDTIEFAHGGDEYDSKYPDGIPTSVVITDTAGATHDSGLVMYPTGHARNTTADLEVALAYKFNLLGKLAFSDPKPIIDRYNSIASLSADEIQTINNYDITMHGSFE
ncbi:MAG: hypothetical protein AAFN41_13540, partial [Planctomycetota bacterium]